MAGKKLICSGDVQSNGKQHTKPCSDCPWSRDALPGWLGGNSIEEWIQFAHSDVVIPCHVLEPAQCAGAAIYRRNVCKMAYPPNIQLEKDTETVFANPTQFTEHHTTSLRDWGSEGRDFLLEEDEEEY